MHGATLVTTAELVCVYAPPREPILDEIETWADENGLTVRFVAVGNALPETASQHRSLAVAVGGDGVFLETVSRCAPRGIPILGVNRGQLSFLPRLPADDATEALAEVIDGRAAVVARQQLRVETTGLASAGVNDVSIEPPRAVPPDRPTVGLETFCGLEYVGRYDGEGLVVATPTGSTAWSLSARAPIHRPAQNRTLQIVPLHHDGLGARPIVVGADRTIEVVPEDPARVWVDGGREVTTVQAGSPVRLTGADRPAHIVRTSYESPFMATLAEKLGWSLRRRGPTPLEPGPYEPITAGEPAGSASGDTDRVGAYRNRWPMQDERPGNWPRRRRSTESDTATLARRIACEAATAAGECIQWYFQQRAHEKRRAEIAEDAAVASEAILETVIGTAFPDHEIRSEADQLRAGSGPYTWLLDPIDGMTNFRQGHPTYCTSLALLEGDEPVVGVVAVPETDELFHAAKGHGAIRNGRGIEPTDRTDLAKSMLLSGYDPDGQFLDRLYRESRGVRKLGSQALNLCFVAAGSADAVWEYDTYPWDVAAGLCLLREAGGTTTGPDGEPYDLTVTGRTPLLASNGPLQSPLLELIADFGG